MNNLNKQFKIFEIIENTNIIYTDDNSELFEAIYIKDNGVIFGRILKIEEETDDTYQEEFVGCGYISNNSIKKIEKGSKRKILRRVR